MCGIHAGISKADHIPPSTELQKLLCQRGPDHLGYNETTVSGDEIENTYLTFTSTVLTLRGGHMTAQPFIHSVTGSIFCWNGEAWRIGENVVEGNDGEKIFQLLLETSCATAEKSVAISRTLTALSSISGPFAFVYFHKPSNCLYFGRDRLGRRSLLYNMDGESRSAQFSSLAEPGENGWAEVEADGLYRLSYDREETVCATGNEVSHMSNSDYKIYHYSWDTILQGSPGNHASSLGTLNRETPVDNHSLNFKSGTVDQLEYQLQSSLKLRLSNLPRPPAAKTPRAAKVAVLFSGGLDCTVLARMAHNILPSEQEIDLLNVAFENPRVLKAAQEQRRKAVKKMIDSKDPNREQQSKQSHNNELFSKISLDQDSVSLYEDCPDRITGRKAFEELKQICKERTWRFVEINISYTETTSHRAQVISLIYPHATEMDLSIAYALYFASRGSGSATTSTGRQVMHYITTARVLLSGLGADELFAGYTRHATAFSRHSYEGLINELDLDVNRLGKRNLGRDDRVISHWGREARFPYLDEAFVNWALSCPVWEKADFGSSANVDEAAEIEPGKKVLRLLAHRLGLVSVAREKKRAIQFGARTAKMETGRTKGTSLIS